MERILAIPIPEPQIQARVETPSYATSPSPTLSVEKERLPSFISHGYTKKHMFARRDNLNWENLRK